MNNLIAQLPTIGITLGDPAGIGPEVVVKSLATHLSLSKRLYNPLVIGSKYIFDQAIRAYAPQLNSLALSDEKNISSLKWEENTIPVFAIETPGIQNIIVGESRSEAGHASVKSIEKAAYLANSGLVNAISTAPINKESVALAGYTELGHQEMLSRIAKVDKIATMLMARKLRVVHLTTHVPFRDAYKYVTKERILSHIQLTDLSFKKWGVKNPRIGVAALNPHGGDGGLFGSEESNEIQPAIDSAIQEGINVKGPIPADSIFLRGAEGEFDAVLALYHDQGHISVKMHDFHKSTSINLGLPFIRTSVDHGTAFDIAGKGIASSTSMEEALQIAAMLALGQGFH